MRILFNNYSILDGPFRPSFSTQDNLIEGGSDVPLYHTILAPLDANYNFDLITADVSLKIEFIVLIRKSQIN